VLLRAKALIVLGVCHPGMNARVSAGALSLYKDWRSFFIPHQLTNHGIYAVVNQCSLFRALALMYSFIKRINIKASDNFPAQFLKQKVPDDNFQSRSSE
jgi:hypothetical protein